MIATSVGIGISKKDLLNDYYWDELEQVLDEYSIINNIENDDDTEELSSNIEEFISL